MFFQYQKSAFFKHLPILLIVSALGALAVMYSYQRKKAIDYALATSIYAVLDKYRITYDIDACGVDPTIDTTAQLATGVKPFVSQIARFVANKQPLNLLVVSFPFKSANHDKKTLGSLPDMAERKSLEYLQAILHEIKQVYGPGAKLTIFCDGIPFAPIFNIPYSDVEAYQKALQALASDLPDIKLYTAADFMHDYGLKRLEDINTYIDMFAPTKGKDEPSKQAQETVRKRVLLEFDYQRGQLFLVQQSLDTTLHRLQRREAAFQNYVNAKFPTSDYIRLTVHFSRDISKKFGIKLSPHSCVTPYHGVLVQELDGSYSIQFKKDVDLNNYTLATTIINGINCPYFKHNERK